MMSSIKCWRCRCGRRAVRSSAFCYIAPFITQQKQAEERFVTAKLAAERANPAKTSFLAAASHDLRQPVQALALFAKPPANRVAEPASKNLVRLIQQMGQVSGGPSWRQSCTCRSWMLGTVGTEHTFAAVRRLSGRLCEEIPSQAAERGSAPDLRQHGPRKLLSDPLLLERIRLKLISNAIRYTEGGRVLIGADARERRLSVEVWDTGIGIPPDQFGEIFREFHRSHHKSRETHKSHQGLRDRTGRR